MGTQSSGGAIGPRPSTLSQLWAPASPTCTLVAASPCPQHDVVPRDPSKHLQQVGRAVMVSVCLHCQAIAQGSSSAERQRLEEDRLQTECWLNDANGEKKDSATCRAEDNLSFQ